MSYFLAGLTPRISCGVRAPVILTVLERAARRQLNAHVGRLTLANHLLGPSKLA